MEMLKERKLLLVVFFRMRSEDMEQQVKIVESGDVVGAEVRGVDLSRPMSDEVFTAVESALNDRAVLCFRQQHLSEPQFIDFAHRFGEIERI